MERIAKGKIGFIYVNARSLKKAISDGEEFVILDPREEGDYSEGHLLLAVNVPLSKLEIQIENLVPRKTTRIILTDRRNGLAERTALRLRELGYRTIAILDGGISAWSSAGYELFSGINVPSKAFGEWVEQYYHTPSISAVELHTKLIGKENVAILDSRPFEEYQEMTIPGAINVPGAELVYRFHALAIQPDMPVVVTCAGRTRGILGAQSLINIGVKNRIAVLQGGCMAWHLAGYSWEQGADRQVREPSDREFHQVKEAVSKVAERFGVETIDARKLAEFETQRHMKTVYLFDVRTQEEYNAGHLPGSIHAPGGQLIQATDRWIAVRNARIVLIDDQIVRAQMTASWLVQSGWRNVNVLANPFVGRNLETGQRPFALRDLDRINLSVIQPADLYGAIQQGASTVIDFANSYSYRKGHIPGAWFAIRGRIEECLKQIPASESFVATGDNEVLVTLAASDVASISGKPVSILAGGNEGWRKANLPINEGFERVTTDTDDIWLGPYREENTKKAMQVYLEWEEALPEQITRDGDLEFGLVVNR